MDKRIFIIVTLLVFLCFPIFAFAETIVTKSGKVVEGKLIEKTDKYIKIDFQGVPLTYFFDGIESIDGKPVSLIEYHKIAIAPPKNSETRQILDKGITYFRQGLYDKAIAEFNRAEQIEPNISEIYNNRASVYATIKEYDKAIFDFSKAIEITPNIAEFYNNRGLIYVNKDDFDLAIADYNKAIEINPRSADYYANRGVAYSKKGDFERSILDLNKALEFNPNLPGVNFCLAVSYYFAHDYDKSWENVYKAKTLGEEIETDFLEALRQASGRQN